MVTLLAKIFIQEKNDQAKIREEYGVLCGVVGILFNVLLFAGKFLAGTISHSIAITADAVNNLSDAGSSVVTLFIAMGMVSGIQKRSLPDWLG